MVIWSPSSETVWPVQKCRKPTFRRSSSGSSRRRSGSVPASARIGGVGGEGKLDDGDQAGPIRAVGGLVEPVEERLEHGPHLFAHLVQLLGGQVDGEIAVAGGLLPFQRLLRAL